MPMSRAKPPKNLPKPNTPNIYLRANAYEIYLTIPSYRRSRTYIGRCASLEEAIALRDSVLDKLHAQGVVCNSRRSFSSPGEGNDLRVGNLLSSLRH